MHTGSRTTDRPSHVLVTGVEQPLGRAVALTLAARWNVVAHSFTLPAAQGVVRQIHNSGGHAHAIAADLTVAAAASDMYRQLRADHQAICAVLHCASLPGPESATQSLDRIHPSDWYRFTHLHLAMLLHTVQGAVEAFDHSGTPGAIVTVALPDDGGHSLARATIDGATSSFMSSLACLDEPAPLTLRHLQWSTDGTETLLSALNLVGEALDAALQVTAEVVEAGTRSAI